MLSATSRVELVLFFAIFGVTIFLKQMLACMVAASSIIPMFVLYFIYWRKGRSIQDISLDQMIQMFFSGLFPAFILVRFFKYLLEFFLNEALLTHTRTSVILKLVYLCITSFIITGIVEETFKTLLARLPTYMKKRLGYLGSNYVENPKAILLSFVAVAAGFATIENALFAYNEGVKTGSLVPWQLLTRNMMFVPLQCCCAAITGLQFIRNDYVAPMSKLLRYLPAILVHGCFDFAISTADYLREASIINDTAMVLITCAAFVAFVIHPLCLVRQTYNKLDVHRLAEEYRMRAAASAVEAGKRPAIGEASSFNENENVGDTEQTVGTPATTADPGSAKAINGLYEAHTV